MTLLNLCVQDIDFRVGGTASNEEACPPATPSTPTVWSLLRDPPVEIRRPFVRPQLQYHLPALCAGGVLKEAFVSRRSLLSGGDKRKIQGINKIEI